MLIYNVTIQIEKEIAAQWLHWLMHEHIPDVMNTGCFVDHQIVKLLDADESEALTYAVQYRAANREILDKYLNQHAPALRKEGTKKWGARFVAFRTIMEVIR